MENKKKIGDEDEVDIMSWKRHDDHGVEEEEEEESEDMKMEKFYSLIRKYHDARNHLRLRNAPPPPPQDHGDDDEVLLDNSKKRRKKMSGDGDAAGGGGNWVPSFEVGDFAKEVEFRGPAPLLFPSLYSCNNTCTAEQKQDDETNESLDLKLAL